MADQTLAQALDAFQKAKENAEKMQAELETARLILTGKLREAGIAELLGATTGGGKRGMRTPTGFAGKPNQKAKVELDKLLKSKPKAIDLETRKAIAEAASCSTADVMATLRAYYLNVPQDGRKGRSAVWGPK